MLGCSTAVPLHRWSLGLFGVLGSVDFVGVHLHRLVLVVRVVQTGSVYPEAKLRCGCSYSVRRNMEVERCANDDGTVKLVLPSGA